MWDVAEFFVLKRFRRAGVGRAAALQLWAKLGGAWAVRVAEHHAAALSFWRRAIAAYEAGVVRELAWESSGAPWKVFHLQPNAD